jgi:hypothetical protein
MTRVKKRLTYANVVSSIALFLVLGGATAFAAHQLGKHSVGTKQLKANAVTTAKIKKGAVTAAKIGTGAVGTGQLAKAGVTGEKIAAGTITGANINAPSTPFSQVVARLRTSSQVLFEGPEPPLYPIGSYTQAAGEDDQYLAGLEITFEGSCGSPREAEAFLVEGVSSPSEFSLGKVLGLGIVEDEGSGAVTKQMEIGPFEFAPMARLAPAAATNRNISAFLIEEECKTGSGIIATGGQVDVVATK